MALQTKEFEQGRTSMNAYVVYKEAASIGKALGGMQGFLFVGHHLRVDSCADSVNFPGHCIKYLCIYFLVFLEPTQQEEDNFRG